MIAIQSIRDFFGPLPQPPNLPPGKRVIWSNPLVGWPGLVKSQFRIIENRFDELCRKVDLEQLLATWSKVGYKSDGTRRSASTALGFPPGQASGQSGNPDTDRDPTLEATYLSFERAVKALGRQLDALSRDKSTAFLYSTLPESDEGDQDPDALADPPELRSALAPSDNGTAAADTEPNGRGSKAPAEPLVILGKRGDDPIVRGNKKARLLVSQYNVIKALLDAGDEGLSKNALEEKSGHTDAVNILKRLRKDADWERVIQLGKRAGGRYRISH